MTNARVRTDWKATSPTMRRFYPEAQAGGFSNIDGTFLFYARINSLISQDTTILNLGAGRGWRLTDSHSGYKRELETMKDKVQDVIGADVDEAIQSNPDMSRVIMIEADGKLALPDASVDLIICDWVVEHIEKPELFVSEVARVLRKGGWFCGRTTNRYGYISLASRMIPERLHERVLRRVQPNRKKEDVFPAFYRMNTMGQIATLFPEPKWLNATSYHSPEPAYFGSSALAWQTALFWNRIMPQFMSPVLMLFLQKQQ